METQLGILGGPRIGARPILWGMHAADVALVPGRPGPRERQDQQKSHPTSAARHCQEVPSVLSEDLYGTISVAAIDHTSQPAYGPETGA